MYIPCISGEAFIWNLATPDIGFLPDIGSPDDTISGHMTRYRVFRLTRYRDSDMSDVTRYRVPISGTHPISGHHITDIVNHIPDIGINIGINIWCPDIGDMIFRYQCQYRVPISGVPISGYDSHRYRGQSISGTISGPSHTVCSSATACTIFLTYDLDSHQRLFEAAICLSRSFENALTSA